MKNFFISLLAWFILGITGSIFKILQYETVFYIIFPFNVAAFISAIYFIVKKLRTLLSTQSVSVSSPKNNNMKIIHFLALFLISNTIFGQDKIMDTLKFEIVYNYTYQINKENASNIKSDNMVLKIGNRISEYICNNEIIAKQKFKEMKLSGNSDMRNVPKATILYRIIKDNKKEEMLFFNQFGVTKMFYKEPLNQMIWSLINEEKVILGYNCKKAITTFSGREYIAWYSTDIILSDGPYKFNGLPGLIFSISDTNNHHRFEINGIKKINEVYNLDYENHVSVTKKEYVATVNKFKDKPSLMFQTEFIQFPKEMLDKIDVNGKELYKYENNPIELKD